MGHNCCLLNILDIQRLSTHTSLFCVLSFLNTATLSHLRLYGSTSSQVVSMLSKISKHLTGLMEKSMVTQSMLVFLLRHHVTPFNVSSSMQMLSIEGIGVNRMKDFHTLREIMKLKRLGSLETSSLLGRLLTVVLLMPLVIHIIIIQQSQSVPRVKDL